MRSRGWSIILMTVAALALISACGGDDDGGTSRTPGQDADGAATTAPPGDGDDGQTPDQDGDGAANTAPPDNGENGGSGGDGGSAIITFFGDVDGAIEVSGMSCDHFPNAADDESDDSFTASISGMIGDEGFTLDLGTQRGETLGSVRLTRSGEAFGTWDNQLNLEPDPDSGSFAFTESGGELEFTLEPTAVDPGTATESVTIAGTWECPGGTYTTFGG